MYLSNATQTRHSKQRHDSESVFCKSALYSGSTNKKVIVSNLHFCYFVYFGPSVKNFRTNPKLNQPISKTVFMNKSVQCMIKVPCEVVFIGYSAILKE